MKAFLLWMIRFYRSAISPLRPPCCRFIPTCSQYALEAVENGRARGPVSLADLEDGAAITIQLNGKQEPYREELTESGDYRIWVMDEAGNLTTYEFSILVYFDFNSLVFIGMLVAVLVAVGAYIVLSRKRLEVR